MRIGQIVRTPSGKIVIVVGVASEGCWRCDDGRVYPESDLRPASSEELVEKQRELAQKARLIDEFVEWEAKNR